MKIRDTFTEEELEKYPELGKPKNLFCLKYILNRIKKGKNALILTYGVTGSGKSWVNLRMSELLCIMQGFKFDTQNKVFFDFKGLLNYTNKKDLQPGDVSISEELGVSMGARKWQKNIDYSELLQTFRDLGLICFFNVPFRSMADKHARLLSHFQIEMLARRGNLNTIKFFVLQHNPGSKYDRGTTYEKYLRVKIKNRGGYCNRLPIKKLCWKKPSKDVLDLYLPMQNEYKASVRKRLLNKTIKEGEEDNTPTRTSKIDDKIVKEHMDMGLKIKESAELLGVCELTISRHRANIKKLTPN